jgi:heme A synthase
VKADRFFLPALWVATILILVITTVQGVTGRWYVFYFLWPNGPTIASWFMPYLVKMGPFHKVVGFVIGGLSILIFIFALGSKSRGWVKIFAFVGLVVTIVAAVGGIMYVTSGLKDRWSLGQMADAMSGVLLAYLVQFYFMNRKGYRPKIDTSGVK